MVGAAAGRVCRTRALPLFAVPWFIVGAESASTAWAAPADVKVPGLLDCEDLPEWRRFRAAASEVVSSGFVRSPALEAQARGLEEAWRAWVCRPSALGEPCRSAAQLSFEFVRELEFHCRGSNNFERYLLRHYFTNTKTVFEPLPEASGFCLYGYLTALVVLAWHALPEHVGQALRYMYTAQHLLGHYHSFDYLESSSWPMTSFLVLVNLHAGQQFIPMLEPPEYGHPGQFGTNWYFERLQWTNTTEAKKPNPGVAPFLPLPLDAMPAKWRGRGRGLVRPHISVWQFCIHTSTAGEAVTMIRRFLGSAYDVEFRGNSIAFQLCGNYEPSLCAQGEAAKFLDWLADRFIAKDMPYDELSVHFQRKLLPELARADVWMCSIPAVWCRLLMDAARALEEGEHGRKSQPPIFAYLGLPIFQYVAREERDVFLQAFGDLVRDERNVVVANNPYLAEEIAWQTGLRVPTLRIHGLHTNSTYLPLRASEVLVSRPGTSGGLQECLLNSFVDANLGYPLKFVQFTDLLDPHTTSEVYNSSLSYASLALYRAVVGFPYDTSLMFFWEFYSMNMPLFVPFQLWRWGLFGQHTRRDLEEPTIDGAALDRAPYSPFFDGFSPLDVESALYWSKFTDWAMFPHVQYFKCLPELMVALVHVDLQAISTAMKRFNEVSLVQSVSAWRFVVERWLDVETLT